MHRAAACHSQVALAVLICSSLALRRCYSSEVVLTLSELNVSCALPRGRGCATIIGPGRRYSVRTWVSLAPHSSCWWTGPAAHGHRRTAIFCVLHCCWPPDLCSLHVGRRTGELDVWRFKKNAEYVWVLYTTSVDKKNYLVTKAASHIEQKAWLINLPKSKIQREPQTPPFQCTPSTSK